MKLDNVIAVRAAKKIYRDGDVVIKVFDEGFSKSDILNEALGHARAEETALNVPALQEVCMIDGKWAIVTQYIEGKTLAKMMEEQPERREELMARFVELQLEMHRQRSPLMPRLRDKMHRKISQTCLDATTRYDLNMRLEAMPDHNKLCHGDFNPTNIIITPDDVPYILDWSHATQGNASADAARTYLLFWLAGEKEMASEYMQLFCSRSDTPRQYVQKWLPIVAASQSVKGKPEERELLLRWVDVVDYQ